MKVYVAMAEIGGAVRLCGVYKERNGAEAKCSEVEHRNFFFADDGDETWIEEEEVK